MVRVSVRGHEVLQDQRYDYGEEEEAYGAFSAGGGGRLGGTAGTHCGEDFGATHAADAAGGFAGAGDGALPPLPMNPPDAPCIPESIIAVRSEPLGFAREGRNNKVQKL